MLVHIMELLCLNVKVLNLWVMFNILKCWGDLNKTNQANKIDVAEE